LSIKSGGPPIRIAATIKPRRMTITIAVREESWICLTLSIK